MATLGTIIEPRTRGISAAEIAAFVDATGDRCRGDLAPPMIVAMGSIIDGVLPTVMDPRVIGDQSRLLRLLHGDEEIVWSGLVRAGDTLTTSASVESSEEKSSGELLCIGTRVTNQRGELIAVTRSSLLIRDRRPTSLRAMKDELPRREEPGPQTFSRTWRVAEDQSVRYAAASGDRNPIHLDDEVARRAGLRGRILHGMCTMAFAQRAVIDALGGGDPASLESLRVRFTKPVYPGDELTCTGWNMGARRVGLEVRNQDGLVVLREASALVRSSEVRYGG